MKNTTEHPPANAKRVCRRADLSATTETAINILMNPGEEPRQITISKHKRQVLEGLLTGPLYAASYRRHSDQVLPHRPDQGLNIRCEMYRSDPETGRERFGIHFFDTVVIRTSEKQ